MENIEFGGISTENEVWIPPPGYPDIKRRSLWRRIFFIVGVETVVLTIPVT